MDVEADKALAQVVKSLIALRGENYTRIKEQTDVDGSNLSGWLKGMPQRISEKRKQTVARYLGIENGMLRDDIAHDWGESPPFENLKTVIEYVAQQQGGPILEVDRARGESASMPAEGENFRPWLLRYGNTKVRFAEYRGAQGGPDLVQSLGDRVALSWNNKGALDTRAMERLWERAASDKDALQELLVYLTRQLLGRTSSSYQDAEGVDWSTLMQMLAKAIAEERPIGEVLGRIDEEEGEG